MTLITSKVVRVYGVGPGLKDGALRVALHPFQPRRYLFGGEESDQLLCRNVKRFRGGLVFEAHRLLYHSTLGLRVIQKKKRDRGLVIPGSGKAFLSHREDTALCREVGHREIKGNREIGAIWSTFEKFSTNNFSEVDINGSIFQFPIFRWPISLHIALTDERLLNDAAK